MDKTVAYFYKKLLLIFFQMQRSQPPVYWLCDYLSWSINVV